MGNGQLDVSFKPLRAVGISCIRCHIDTFTNCLSAQQLTKSYTQTTLNCGTLPQ